MPRDWMDEGRGRDERRARRDEDRDRGRDEPRDDFGLADYSRDYVYDEDRRAAYRAGPAAEGDDYGQADYSDDYAYDPRTGSAYRRADEREARRDLGRDGSPDREYGRRMDAGGYRPDPRDEAPRAGERSRSWLGGAGGFFGARRDEAEAPRRRRGPSDRVLWAVIVERLEDERRLDLRDVEVVVQDGEVTLNGTVRRKEDKRRIEDVADIDGVRHVQNNLRVHERGHWTFF